MSTAVYGITHYSAGTYGESNTALLRASNFTARPEDYDKLFLSWDNPGGTYDSLLLVRSSWGFPTTPGEGTTLFTDAAASARTSYLDGAPYPVSPGPLNPGRFYYYTLFIYTSSTGAYQAVGYAMALVTYPYGSGDRLWNLLAEVHRIMDADQPLVNEQGPLQRFLNLFGYQLDSVRTEIGTLLDVYNMDLVSGNLLPVMAASFGVPYEPELGQRRSRIILKNAAYLAKMKGTKPGIEALVSAYTGWGATAVIGANELLNYNDSGFFEGVGNWVFTNATVLWQDSIAYSPPVANYGSGKLTATSTSNITATLGTAVGQTLVPVSASTQYTASAYVLAETSTPNARIDIVWYTAAGVVISTSTGTASAMTSSWARRSVTATSPANAAYAQLLVTIVTPTNTAVYHLGAAQIEKAAAASTWVPGRQINVYIDPERVNLVPNPSAEVNTTGWTALTGSTFTRVTSRAFSGTASFNVTRSASTGTAGGQTAAGTSGFPVFPSEPYTVSAYFSAGTTSRQCRVGVQFYTAAGATVGGVVYGTQVANASGTTNWTRATVTTTSPATAAYASVLVEVLSVPTGENQYIDGVMVENDDIVGAYFDGATLPTSDFLWSGTAHQSTSNYYPRRDIKDYRLRTVMAPYIPAGLTVATFYGSIAPASSV